MNTTKIALAALLVATSASFAMAEPDSAPNPTSRFPAYSQPGAQAPSTYVAPRGTLRSAPVQLNQGGGSVNWDNWTPPPARGEGVG